MSAVFYNVAGRRPSITTSIDDTPTSTPRPGTQTPNAAQSQSSERSRPHRPAPELLLELADEALLDLVVRLEELVGDHHHDGVGLAPHRHLLGRRDVQVLQVRLPLLIVALVFVAFFWGAG